MNLFPRISCIIPIYNASKYLHRCIDSLLTQDYPNLELVLVDDGSTDNSIDICSKYAVDNGNIVLVHIPNGGASLARKKGIDMAKGEFLTFVDSDDYVLPNYVSSMYMALQGSGLQVAGCGVQTVTVGEEIKKERICHTYLLQDYILMYRFFNYEFWRMWGGLYKREVFEQLNFSKATLSEDYFVKAQMFAHDCHMVYVDAPLYIYEKHEGSLSQTTLSIRAFEEFENVELVYKLTREKMPQYTALALKNVVETCIKLLLMGTASERSQYKEQYGPIYAFLKETTECIYDNNYLQKKLKVIALVLRYCPAMSRILNLLL